MLMILCKFAAALQICIKFIPDFQEDVPEKDNLCYPVKNFRMV